MDLASLPLFSALGKKMGWLNERQKVLTENIANADTPGYRPKDLKKPTFKSHLDEFNGGGPTLQLRTSDKGHVKPGQIDFQDSMTPELQKAASFKPNGNAVSLEDELTKMAETQIEYSMVTNLYRKHTALLKTDLGRK